MAACKTEESSPYALMELLTNSEQRFVCELFVALVSDNLVLQNTNVIELYNLILKKAGSNQLTWYNSGIGTYARPSWASLKYWLQVLGNKIDLAIAWYVTLFGTVTKSCFYLMLVYRNFERTVMGAYRWLSDNYQEGDRIFLFGSSTCCSRIPID